MLTIRNVQLEALRNAMVHRFAQSLMEHATRYFPEVCGWLGKDLGEAVAYSIQRARLYGFDGQREICKFLNLQFHFGRDFDEDPQCAWAHELLKSSLPGPAKMERLYRVAIEHEAEACGYFAKVGEHHER